MTCIIAGIVCELALCVALRRWPPTAVPLGVGLGAGGFLFMDRDASDYPSWFGPALTVCATIGMLISLALWGV